MNNRLLCKTAFLLLLLITTSCIFRPYQQVDYYDIVTKPAEEASTQPNVDFPLVTVQGPFRTKMVFRITKHKIMFDEFNRWSQTPDSLLKRYMEQSFPKNPKNEKKPFKVTVKILNIEGDRFNKKTVFSAEYTIKTPNGIIKEYSFSKDQKSENLTPEVLADNTAAAFSELATSIRKNILNLK
jgi:hypothetical protein